jgi:carbon storage regulator
MLVLTRRISEKLIIGENVEITIVRIDGGQVRIGINAPKDVPIRRAELAEFSESEKTKARKPAPAAKKSKEDMPMPMPVLNPFMNFA